MRNPTQNGFTLIELLISIVIVVILSTIGIASFNSANAKNGVEQRAAEIRSLARKLRTDAGAALKPSSCLSVVPAATVAGSFINFTSGSGGAYSYGVSCFELNGITGHPSVTNATLPNGFKFNTAITILFPFNGLAISTPKLPAALVASDFTGTPIPTPTSVDISDGTNDYYVYFNGNGLVCEQKTNTSPICAN